MKNLIHFSLALAVYICSFSVCQERPLSLQDIKRISSRSEAEAAAVLEQEAKRIEKKIGSENYNKLAEVWNMDDITHCLTAQAIGCGNYHGRAKARVSSNEIVTLIQENGVEKEISLTTAEFIICSGLILKKQGLLK